jgi:NADPH:quinone reductase
MPRAVRFEAYGDVDVLQVVEVTQPDPAPTQVVVQVLAAGVNPGEIAIRRGALAERFPATFPSGQGTDFAGRVVEVGDEVTAFAVGDEILGWSERRSAQADFVVSDVDYLVPKPPSLDWIRAGSLFVVGVTAFAAVRAVSIQPGDVVAVSSAAGGVGSLAVQLARRAGARVIGIAGAGNAVWLRSVGAEPVAYGDGLADRLRAGAPDGIDAFIDTHGDGYVDLAIDLGVSPKRIDTIIDYEAVERLGVNGDGSAQASTADVLAQIADLVAWGDLLMPIAAVYPLAQLRDAYIELGRRHTRGKIVLSMAMADDDTPRHRPS